MEPDTADIPGRQWLKIGDVHYVDRVVGIAISVLANVDDCVFGVGVKHDMMQSKLGRLVAGYRDPVYNVL